MSSSIALIVLIFTMSAKERKCQHSTENRFLVRFLVFVAFHLSRGILWVVGPKPLPTIVESPEEGPENDLISALPQGFRELDKQGQEEREQRSAFIE
jgi:hypothetical protein